MQTMRSYIFYTCTHLDMQSVCPEAKVLATSTNALAGDQKVKRRVVITFGTYDLFHVGHLNIIERCKSYGDTLIVGVSRHSRKRADSRSMTRQ